MSTKYDQQNESIEVQKQKVISEKWQGYQYHHLSEKPKKVLRHSKLQYMLNFPDYAAAAGGEVTENYSLCVFTLCASIYQL